MKLTLLRYLLLLDAAVLFLLGCLLGLAPGNVLRVFGFNDLPVATHYLISMWGGVLLTLAIGYVVAAGNPIRHRIWAQIGIARGALEAIAGLVYVANGTISFRQAGLGIIIGAVIALAYLVLLPRRPRLVASATPPSAASAAAT